jgi:hypothetical protein
MKPFFKFVSILFLIWPFALAQIQIFPDVVERGRHVLIQTATTNIIEVNIIDATGKVLALERTTKLTSNIAVFMVPYYIPDNTYRVMVGNEESSLTIQGDLSKDALGWFCGHLGLAEPPLNDPKAPANRRDLGAVTSPNCAEPGEDIDTVINATTIANASEFTWSPSPIVFVAGISINTVDPNNFSFTLPGKNLSMKVPSGINEVFVLSPTGIQSALVNILRDVEANSIVVSMEPTENDVEGLLEKISGDLSLNPTFKTLNGPTASTGLCGGTMTLLTSSVA